MADARSRPFVILGLAVAGVAGFLIGRWSAGLSQTTDPVVTTVQESEPSKTSADPGLVQFAECLDRWSKAHKTGKGPEIELQRDGEGRVKFLLTTIVAPSGTRYVYLLGIQPNGQPAIETCNIEDPSQSGSSLTFGRWRVWDAQGNLNNEYFMDEYGRQVGPVRGWHSNGQMSSEHVMNAEGKPIGLFTEWNEDGTVKQQFPASELCTGVIVVTEEGTDGQAQRYYWDKKNSDRILPLTADTLDKDRKARKDEAKDY